MAKKVHFKWTKVHIHTFQAITDVNRAELILTILNQDYL